MFYHRKFLCRIGVHRWNSQLVWNTRTSYGLTRYVNICRDCKEES